MVALRPSSFVSQPADQAKPANPVTNADLQAGNRGQLPTKNIR